MTSDRLGYVERVRNTAKKELEHEEFREAVKRCKERLRQRKWWHRLVPFKILIIRRDDH